MSIEEFFRGKHIFITGGSGFLGKVLIEKLLRSCGGLEKIYVLLRDKRNQSSEERLSKIVDCPLFDKLKEINPEALKKLVPVSGDASDLNLGLNEKDERTITENVDIIYHVAASVKFDDHLKYSVLLNTRGTREAVNLALRAKKLVTFMYISTAYCNCDKKHIEEKLYPAHADWRKTITLAEEADEQTLEVLSQKYIHPFPNTYVFSKSLAEQIVNDMAKGKLLTAILRPTIVVSSVDDPFPGWIDNFNGPIGFIAAGGKGLLRMLYVDQNAVMNFIPVDTVIKFIILATYEKALSKNLDEVAVYNAASVKQSCVTYGGLTNAILKMKWIAPYEKALWYPSMATTNCFYYYFITCILYHLIPAVVVDGLLNLIGQKPMLLKIQRKVYIVNMAIIYFLQKTWTFANDNCLALSKYITDTEKDAFSFEKVFHLAADTEEGFEYYLKARYGGQKFLFKENFNKEKSFRNVKIMWVLDCILKTVLYGGLYWFLTTKLKIFTILSNSVNRYLLYLNNL